MAFTTARAGGDGRSLQAATVCYNGMLGTPYIDRIASR
jgi:hypothetical protein